VTKLIRLLAGRLLPRRRQPFQTLHVSGDSVSINQTDQEPIQFRWAEVLEIATFKRDFFTYDDIRLAFRFADGWLEISEESEGWCEVAVAMAKYFPEIPPEWYFEVMRPAFETNYRVLFKHESPMSGDASNPPH
jgi:hypothetical protein